MNRIEKRAGAGLGVAAYVVATAVGLSSGVPIGVVLLRAALVAVGGYVVGRLLGHVVLQAFLDDLAEAKSRRAEEAEEPQG